MTTLFSEDHEYIKIEDGVSVPGGASVKTGYVGITDYAQKALGDVVYVELPTVGKRLEKGDVAGVVESVKSASEIYSPVSGEVIEINVAVSANPALVNQDPLGTAWFFKIKISNDTELKELKDEAGYKSFIGG